MNLNKAQRLLGEVIERQNMYVTAAQYNDGVNNKQYGKPWCARGWVGGWVGGGSHTS